MKMAERMVDSPRLRWELKEQSDLELSVDILSSSR